MILTGRPIQAAPSKEKEGKEAGCVCAWEGEGGGWEGGGSPLDGRGRSSWRRRRDLKEGKRGESRYFEGNGEGKWPNFV